MLAWARELGAWDVPSLHALHKCQEKIRNHVGNPTQKVTTPSGNVFYRNSIGSAIAMVCFILSLLVNATDSSCRTIQTLSLTFACATIRKMGEGPCLKYTMDQRCCMIFLRNFWFRPSVLTRRYTFEMSCFGRQLGISFPFASFKARFPFTTPTNCPYKSLP